MPRKGDVQRGGGDPNIMQMKDDNRIRILEPLDAGMVWYRHVIEDKSDPEANGKFINCPGVSTCPLCRKPVTVDDEGKVKRLWPRSRRIAYNVWNYETNKVEVMMIGPSIDKELEANEKIGYDPTKYDFRIVRMGKGLNTSYTVARGEDLPLPQEVGPDSLHDLSKYDQATTPQQIFEALEKAGWDYDAIVVPEFDSDEANSFVMPFGKHRGMTIEQILATDPDWAEWLHENKLADGNIGDPVFIALQKAMEDRNMVPPLDANLPSAPAEQAEQYKPEVAGPPATTVEAPEATKVKLASPTGDEIEVDENVVASLLASGFTRIEEPEPEAETEAAFSIDDDAEVEVEIGGAGLSMTVAAAKASLSAGAPVVFKDPQVEAFVKGAVTSTEQPTPDPTPEPTPEPEGTPTADGLNAVELLALPKDELKAKAQALGHKVSGSKSDLAGRILSGPVAQAEEAPPTNGSANGSSDREAVMDEVKALIDAGDFSDYKVLLEKLRSVAGKTNIVEFSDEELVELRDSLKADAS